MMQTKNKNAMTLTALATLGVITISSLTALTPPAEAASSKTWKKIAIGAGVATAYGQIAGKRNVRNIGAAATVGSYLVYRHKKKQEQRRHRYYRHRR